MSLDPDDLILNRKQYCCTCIMAKMLWYVNRFFVANWQARRDMICYSSQLVCLIECFGDYLLYYLPLIEYIRLLVNPTLPFFLSSRRCKLHMALEDLFVSCRKLDASARKKSLGRTRKRTSDLQIPPMLDF